MKTMTLLLGVLVIGTVHAEVKPVARSQAEINPQAARTLGNPDMQLSVLKQQMALLQQKQTKQQEEIASLREQNSRLEYCLGRLKSRVSDLEHPGTSDSAAGVVVPSKSIYDTGTDSCP